MIELPRQELCEICETLACPDNLEVIGESVLPSCTSFRTLVVRLGPVMTHRSMMRDANGPESTHRRNALMLIERVREPRVCEEGGIGQRVQEFFQRDFVLFAERDNSSLSVRNE